MPKQLRPNDLIEQLKWYAKNDNFKLEDPSKFIPYDVTLDELFNTAVSLEILLEIAEENNDKVKTRFFIDTYAKFCLKIIKNHILSLTTSNEITEHIQEGVFLLYSA